MLFVAHYNLTTSQLNRHLVGHDDPKFNCDRTQFVVDNSRPTCNASYNLFYSLTWRQAALQVCFGPIGCVCLTTSWSARSWVLALTIYNPPCSLARWKLRLLALFPTRSGGLKWTRMLTHIKNCEVCRLSDKSARTLVTPLQPLPFPPAPCHTIALNFNNEFHKRCRASVSLSSCMTFILNGRKFAL